MFKMINLLDNHLNGLKLELAMIEDMGRPLVLMCYGLEGNGFLAPLTFDVWNAVLAHFDKVSDFNDAVEKAPTLAATVAAIHPNDIIAQAADFNATMSKARPVWAKLQDDNLGRLGDQMRVFRLCRLFNYDFVARHTVEALLEEFNQYAPTVPLLPNTDALRRRFTEYKARATLYATTNPLQPDLAGGQTLSITQQADSLWAFWRQQTIALPEWYRAAEEVALIMTSSAFVERVFSIYDSLFGKEQQSTLEDRREASVLMRVNGNERKKERPM